MSTYPSLSDPIETHQVADRQPAHCDRHGPFESLLWAMVKPSQAPFCKPFWSKCPVCNEEIQREQDELAAKARGTSNEAVRIRRLLEEAGVQARYSSCTLGNFNTALPKQKVAHKWASDYAYKFDQVLESGRSHTLIGNNGTGKTHLCVAIMRHVLLKGGTARYVSCLNLLARFKATFGDRAIETDRVVFADYVMPDLLVVDEIGRHGDSDYDRAALFRVIDHRYQNCKPTLLVTNLPAADYANMMGVSLLDRMREGGGGKITFDFESQRAVDHQREVRE